ncbi:type II toxin-antitoxin system RelE/ParE family toxin [Tepidiphilus baoligensis]|uniref:Type II toxin-antitoxin system RelE/ParE family toxin n=1 Tax=Tepidiphilus baoligensis TaxID=2698687 RepID=A0ABX1QHY6_9PROT|nr:type II toxin-antitoxin system RelE/ParE family toxin [Tepidiphilus baoligensis]NMH15683.1 type II toxin-antitoxin system RelE/ParE family toxin [Tepidiphilus baoligensis]
MARLIFLPQAEADLEAIGDYIARQNPRRAVSFVCELRAQCRKIAQAPKAYRPRPELGPGLHSCAYGNYLVLFFEEPGLVRIVRVLHGAMDIDAQFAEKISTATRRLPGFPLHEMSAHANIELDRQRSRRQTPPGRSFSPARAGR